jgi:hypothetical protein
MIFVLPNLFLLPDFPVGFKIIQNWKGFTLVHWCFQFYTSLYCSGDPTVTCGHKKTPTFVEVFLSVGGLLFHELHSVVSVNVFKFFETLITEVTLSCEVVD